MKKIFLCSLLLFGVLVIAKAQNEGKYVRKGNSAYEEGNYESAAEAYRQGVEENAYSYEANFNLGDALYQQGEFESAAKQFDLLRQPGMDKGQLADVYHNLGNSLMEQQQYAEAAEAYKEALRNNPHDADTRYNLVYALEKLKEQQNQQNEENQEQEQQNEDNQEQQQNEQNEQEQEQEQQEGQDEEQQEQQQKPGQEKEEQQGQQQQAQPKDEISRAEAERILQALQMDENKLHENQKKKKLKGQKVRILKEW